VSGGRGRGARCMTWLHRGESCGNQAIDICWLTANVYHAGEKLFPLPSSLLVFEGPPSQLGIFPPPPPLSIKYGLPLEYWRPIEIVTKPEAGFPIDLGIWLASDHVRPS
jgi:hypothetical protein